MQGFIAVFNDIYDSESVLDFLDRRNFTRSQGALAEAQQTHAARPAALFEVLETCFCFPNIQSI
jgi:hypothetical protein